MQPLIRSIAALESGRSVPPSGSQCHTRPTVLASPHFRQLGQSAPSGGACCQSVNVGPKDRDPLVPETYQIITLPGNTDFAPRLGVNSHLVVGSGNVAAIALRQFWRWVHSTILVTTAHHLHLQLRLTISCDISQSLQYRH